MIGNFTFSEEQLRSAYKFATQYEKSQIFAFNVISAFVSIVILSLLTLIFVSGGNALISGLAMFIFPVNIVLIMMQTIMYFNSKCTNIDMVNHDKMLNIIKKVCGKKTDGTEVSISLH